MFQASWFYQRSTYNKQNTQKFEPKVFDHNMMMANPSIGKSLATKVAIQQQRHVRQDIRGGCIPFSEISQKK